MGKPTLMRQMLGTTAETVGFDPVQDIGGARSDPDLFLPNKPAPLFLDEVQHAPELLACLKRRVDRSPSPGQYMLSGSQNLMPDGLVQIYLDSYVRTYIKREIRTVAAVGDLQLFGRFLGLLAAHTACEVNPSELSLELGVDRKTARRWLAIAEEDARR